MYRSPQASGGAFSVPYYVRSRSGQRAFLKALDYTEGLSAAHPSRQLHERSAEFVFEKTLLTKCQSRGLFRIIGILDWGSILVEPGNLGSVVEYMIFELAHGDVRSFVDATTIRNASWMLQMMHQSAAALRQLHYSNIAHQDIKPSNILLFTDGLAKLADLGRSFDRSAASPHDHCIVPGDIGYAPPELLLGDAPADWKRRRLGCDLYLLGSLFFFFLTNVSMTPILLHRLTPRMHDLVGRQYREILPYIQTVFYGLIQEVEEQLPAPIAGDVAQAIRDLCEPDPDRRGHPRNISRGLRQHSLDRYVTLFDLLERRTEWSRKGRLVHI